MNCGHGTNELHGLCFYEARILFVPASPLQKEPTDPHAILKMRRKQSPLNSVLAMFSVVLLCVMFGAVFANLWVSVSGKLKLSVSLDFFFSFNFIY